MRLLLCPALRYFSYEECVCLFCCRQCLPVLFQRLWRSSVHAVNTAARTRRNTVNGRYSEVVEFNAVFMLSLTFTGSSRLCISALYGRRMEWGRPLYFHAVVCSFSFFFFPSPNLSRRRLDVCHTSTHGVALVRI